MQVENKSKKWDKLYAGGTKYRQLNKIFLDRLINKVEKIIGSRIKIVIDLGCGTGDAIDQFEKRGYEVIGVDFSSIAIAKAKEKNPKAQFIEHDLNLLNKLYFKKRVDLIICKLTIVFIKDKEKLLKRVRMLMNKNSVFCLITPVLHPDIDYSAEDKPGVAVDYKEIKELLNKIFRKVIEFHDEFVGEKMHIVTFLAIK